MILLEQGSDIASSVSNGPWDLSLSHMLQSIPIGDCWCLTSSVGFAVSHRPLFRVCLAKRLLLRLDATQPHLLPVLLTLLNSPFILACLVKQKENPFCFLTTPLSRPQLYMVLSEEQCTRTDPLRLAAVQLATTVVLSALWEA